MAKGKVMSTSSPKMITAGGKSGMNTSPVPKGKGASVPDWNNAVSPKNSFMKQTPGRTGTNARGPK
jgi:hypothetical protein